jgi:hypothetical protein
MEIKTKYITPDDFKDYFGIDLELELKNSGNPSNSAVAFIKRIEVRMAAFLDARFYRNIDAEYPKFTDYQKEQYSLALLEQAFYIFKNGDISTDSGYDYDTGEKASNDTIIKKIVAPNSVNHLVNCGLWTTKIKGSRNRGLWGGLW